MSRLKAYYDPSTNMIYNAQRGTYAYWHERRHQEQFNKFKFLIWLYTRGNSFMLNVVSGACVYAIVQPQDAMTVITCVGLFYLTWGAINVAIEMDAVIFGSWYWLKNKKR